MSQIISAVLIVGGTGLIFGCILAFASFIFKVDEDERVGLILSELPGANCGACGFAGCSAYASAVAAGTAPVNSCSVGKDAVAQKIASIMGSEAELSEPMTAQVLCAGTCSSAKYKYEYSGIQDCVAANKLAGGSKSCSFGCIGLGSCVSVCQFDAITINDGVAAINQDKCAACGKCVDKCPKHIIKLIPKKKKYVVECSAQIPGPATTKNCKSGCIGCKICEKNCTAGAISVNEGLAVINYELCTGCGICFEKCPKKIIHLRNEVLLNE